MTEREHPATGDGGGDRAGGDPAGTTGGHGRATARVPVPGESQPGYPPQVKLTPPDAVPQEHRSHAPRAVGCFVLTISDSKTAETDTSGALIRELLMAAGHTVVGQGMVENFLNTTPAERKEFFDEATGEIGRASCRERV